MALHPVTVTGSFSEGGRPARGTIRFRLLESVADPVDHQVLEAVVQEFPLDRAGRLSAVVNTLAGVDATFEVTELVLGVAAGPPYLVTLAATVNTVALGTLGRLDRVVGPPAVPPLSIDGGSAASTFAMAFDGGHA